MKTVFPSHAQLHSGYTRSAVEDHAEQLFNTTTIVLIKQIGYLGYHRPSGNQQSRIGSGELHSPRVIRISRVDQGEKRAGVSENVSRQ